MLNRMQTTLEFAQKAATPTGVDKGGPRGPGPPWPGKNFFVKIEKLLELVVLNLSYRVRSNAMFTSE